MKKRDPIADSLAKDHLIECRHSTNDTETWWITDKGKTYLGAGCTALAETKPAQWDASTEVITDEQLAISGLNKDWNRLYNALRDIISIAKDAQATDTLGDIVKRAEEALP